MAVCKCEIHLELSDKSRIKSSQQSTPLTVASIGKTTSIISEIYWIKEFLKIPLRLYVLHSHHQHHHHHHCHHCHHYWSQSIIIIMAPASLLLWSVVGLLARWQKCTAADKTPIDSSEKNFWGLLFWIESTCRHKIAKLYEILNHRIQSVGAWLVLWKADL